MISISGARDEDENAMTPLPLGYCGSSVREHVRFVVLSTASRSRFAAMVVVAAHEIEKGQRKGG